MPPKDEGPNETSGDRHRSPPPLGKDDGKDVFTELYDCNPVGRGPNETAKAGRVMPATKTTINNNGMESPAWGLAPTGDAKKKGQETKPRAERNHRRRGRDAAASIPMQTRNSKRTKRKRRQRKDLLSRDCFFENENQELRFRFGESYREFVVVQPTPQARANSRFRKGNEA